MPDNLILRPFDGIVDYKILANIHTASENADNLPITISAENLREHLDKIPRFDLHDDLIIALFDGQETGYGRVRWGGGFQQ